MPKATTTQAEKPYDRRKAYENKMKASGYRKVAIWVPKEERALVLELREILSQGLENPGEVEALRDHLCFIYESMLDDEENDEGDHAFAKEKLLLLRKVPYERRQRAKRECQSGAC